MVFPTLQRTASTLAGIGLSLVLLASTTGCVALVVGGAAGAGAIAYQRGALVSNESAGMESTWRACYSAIKDLQFNEVRNKKDALEGMIEARTGAGKTVTFNLHRLTDTTTELRIRVGTFGDEALTRQIHDAVRKAL